MIIIKPEKYKNRTPEIVKALIHAKIGEVLKFEKGTYDFYSDGAYEAYLAPGCNTSGDKKIVFPLFNLKNVTIDGGGSSFIFHDRIFPFAVCKSENITIKNFSLDFSFPRCIIGRVTNSTAEGVRISIDKEKYSFSVNDRGNLLVKAGTHTFSTGEKRYFLRQGYGEQGHEYCCYLSAGKIYYKNENLPAGVLLADAFETDDGIFLKYRPENAENACFAESADILISYDESRENDNFFFEKSKDVVLENIHILHGAGMGFTGQCTENFTLRGCEVSPPDGDGFSTTADAILLTNFTGLVKIENCLIKNTLDDTLCIHGYYAKAESITGPNKAVFRLVHPSQSGVNFLMPGDRVHITDGETTNEKDFATVKSAYFLNELNLITVEFEDRIENSILPGDYIDNPSRTPDVYITGCTFENACHMRLGTAGRVVFENNNVKKCAGVLINDLLSFWNSSGLAHDVTIRNNTFSQCKFGVKTEVARKDTASAFHKNIKILNNRFINCQTAISAEKTDGLYISGNAFKENAKKIYITNCKNVQNNDL